MKKRNTTDRKSNKQNRKSKENIKQKKDNKTIVISLGGSAIVSDTINIEFLKEFRKIIIDFVNSGNKAIIVCGGGKTARDYIEGIKKIITPTNEELDWIGIGATRVNAQFVKVMFEDLAYEIVIEDPTQKVTTEKKIIVCSGWKPGFSTDFDAVLLAEQFKAKEIINISNIDYVYDKDPKKYPEAKKLVSLSWDELIEIVGNKWIPGMNLPFDPIATLEAKRLGMCVKIINKNNIENIKECINGRDFQGTTIK